MNKKKEYISPSIFIQEVEAEQLMLSGSTEGENKDGNPDINIPGEGKGQEPFNSKPNSGLMDWDDEEW